MSLVINHNLMAMNSARNLSNHYSQLSVSTRRLSSGLRIGTAADDAAGLAIRELMRADIATLNQGIRNANDAVSLIQTADGALQIVDEKLIRMKELAEQAATGTYNSDQRLIIDSEYQAMASEITRIAMATDFNGVYLLNGNLESNFHDGSGISASGKLKIHFGTGNDSAEDYYYIQIGESTAAAFGLGNGKTVYYGQSKAGQAAYDAAYNWALSNAQYSSRAQSLALVFQQTTENFYNSAINHANHTSVISENDWNNLSKNQQNEYQRQWGIVAESNLRMHESYALNGADAPMQYRDTEVNGVDIDDILDTRFSMSPTQRDSILNYVARQSSGPFSMYTGTAGTSISTQEAAQYSLNALNQAIISKDKIRANLGALQNRLENTISNLQIQAENLAAAESRISDVDVASEMTEFVREQILTQAAVAMLAQANSLPKLALQLIGG